VERDRVIGYLAAMTDDEYAALSAEARPPEPTNPVTARASIAAKAGQLLNLPRDENGAVGAWAATVAARAPRPTPQPEPPTQQGFTANRAQGASGDGPPAPANNSDWSTKPRIGAPGGSY
jgi:hypothetical protein